jgi:ribosomal protein S20
MTTSPSAVIDSLFHTGADKSPLPEATEYALKLVMPALERLAEKKADKADLADLAGHLQKSDVRPAVKALEAALPLLAEKKADKAALAELASHLRRNDVRPEINALKAALPLLVTKADLQTITLAIAEIDAKWGKMRAAVVAIATAIDASTAAGGYVAAVTTELQGF